MRRHTSAYAAARERHAPVKNSRRAARLATTERGGFDATSGGSVVRWPSLSGCSQTAIAPGAWIRALHTPASARAQQGRFEHATVAAALPHARLRRRQDQGVQPSRLLRQGAGARRAGEPRRAATGDHLVRNMCASSPTRTPRTSRSAPTASASASRTSTRSTACAARAASSGSTSTPACACPISIAGCTSTAGRSGTRPSGFAGSPSAAGWPRRCTAARSSIRRC